MPRNLDGVPRRRWRAPVTLALALLIPKCVACLVGYAGLGALLGYAKPELCGAASAIASQHMTLLITAAGTTGLLLLITHLHGRPPPRPRPLRRP